MFDVSMFDDLDFDFGTSAPTGASVPHPNSLSVPTIAGVHIKTEVADYHGSSSGSPSSSLSSPMELKELGVDFSSPLCVNPFGANHGGGGPHSFMHSPASSSGSPFGMSFPASSGASPLPPVSHFSQSMLIHQQRAHAGQMMHGTPVDGFPQFQFDDVASTSPSPSDAGSPSDAFDSSYQQQLAAQQAAARTRSKMHEMAVRQRLITDQDPRAQGQVQLSLEEKRTLVQEGYAVPTRLPLTKAEEEALKIVRRKIKNKLSAQESRRKRKEYMDTLEARVQGYFSENAQLKARVKQLEAANRQLTAQMQKMQDM